MANRRATEGDGMPTQELKRCQRCVMPSTWAGISFNEDEVCSLCQAYDEEQAIDWAARSYKLRQIFQEYKLLAAKNHRKYDCIIPSSGGKDSTWALYTAKVTYGMNPLVVTWNHGLWMSSAARYNLYNIPQNLDCDHIDFRIGKGLRNGIARKASQVGGDFCAFCHLGVGSFPARIAKQWEIPLIIYGETTALYSTTGDYKIGDMEEQDKRHFELTFQGELSPEKVLPEGYDILDMIPMTWPEGSFPLKAIYLGNYIRWNQVQQVKTITKQLGWKHIKSPITYVNWDKNDCERGECLREIQKFYRRGISRAAFQASKDIRNGLLDREGALRLVAQYERAIESLDVSGVLHELGFRDKEEFLSITKGIRDA